MALKNTHKYDDIIHLPRPVPKGRCPMTDYDRAAQFSPFAALTGFDDTIAETARLTDMRIELDEDEKAVLDAALTELRDRLSARPEIEATYFVYDACKTGGAYRTVRGYVKRIDDYSGCLLLTDGSTIPLREIIALRLVMC